MNWRLAVLIIFAFGIACATANTNKTNNKPLCSSANKQTIGVVAEKPFFSQIRKVLQTKNIKIRQCQTFNKCCTHFVISLQVIEISSGFQVSIHIFEQGYLLWARTKLVSDNHKINTAITTIIQQALKEPLAQIANNSNKRLPKNQSKQSN